MSEGQRSFAREAVAYFLTARPIQLLKTIVAVGWGQYCANANHLVFTSGSLCALSGMVVLWAGLYGLNDIADELADKDTAHKRFRPLARGELRSRQLLTVSALQLSAGLLLLARAGVFGVIIGVGLICNQWSYSFKPLRLKRRFLLDVTSAAVVSHGARFAVGLASGPVRRGVWLAGAALILWKVAAYLTYRLEDVPRAEVTHVGTAARLGARQTSVVSAAAIIGSYVCFIAYAYYTRLPGNVSLAFTVLYAAALTLYLTLFRTGRYPKALEVFVFSAARRNLPSRIRDVAP